MSETYTINMRNEDFSLTRDQIEFDSPNYFTSCFLGGFVESQTRTLRLSRDPDLFKIILDYLSGYQVLPLDDSVIPNRMNRESALRNLLADAQFYLLSGLVAQITSMQATSPPSTNVPSTYVMISSRGLHWDAAMFIDTEMATELRTKHGLGGQFHHMWGSHLPKIQHALRQAGVTTPFILHTSWQETDSNPANNSHLYVVLKIV
ncbi:hypothetical protein BDV93DRAFT_566034 [Ceratobasidium sp. AG-I]|nr:hypothetical protein BDV93DRAFT_566034 [Ceratobasidium sp. AG-I]